MKHLLLKCKLLYRLVSIGLIVALLPAGQLAAQSFTEVFGFPSPSLYSPSLAWGDLDNDGDLDAVLTGSQDGGDSGARTYVIYNNDGSFTQDLFSGLGHAYRGSVALSDYNNDGLLDVFITGIDNTGTSIAELYRNNGGGNFQRLYSAETFAGISRGSAAWGDYDNDGKQDILLTGYNYPSGPITKLYKNTGSGFTEIATSFPGLESSSVAWGDYDNDGKQDLVLCGQNASGVNISKIYHNTGAGFEEAYAGSLLGVASGSVAWGDYNSDGKLDILLTGRSGGISGGTPSTKIYRNTGSGFTEEYDGTMPGVSGGSAAWADFDNDGHLDILLTGSSSLGSISKVYRNTGDDFIDYESSLEGVALGSAAWGDYNNDDKIDIMLSGLSTSERITKLYRNVSGVANTAPAVPANLTAVVSGNDVALEWDRATDGETSQSSLTYNLRIGTTPGGNDIMSSLSSATGYRMLPEDGNIGFYPSSGKVEIKDLPLGTYYWSIQTVDGAFKGSGFAVEQTFKIKETPSLSFSANETTYGYTYFDLAVTTNSTGTVTYTIEEEATADYPGDVTLSGSRITIEKAGKVKLRASIDEDADYAAATITTEFIINKATASIIITNTEQQEDGTSKAVSVRTEPVGLAVRVTYNDSEEAPKTAGKYAVFVTIQDENYQGEETAILEVLAPNAVGDKVEQLAVQLYPNPTQGVLYVELQEAASVEVVTSLGQVMNGQQMQAGKQQLDVSSLSKGLYYLRLTGSKSTVIRRFIKQ